MFEYANELYKLLMRCYEGERDIQTLSHCHDDLAIMFKQLQECDEGQGRFFGTFYRVGFYGELFDSFASSEREFIYREPLITKLAEITGNTRTQTHIHAHTHRHTETHRHTHTHTRTFTHT